MLTLDWRDKLIWEKVIRTTLGFWAYSERIQIGQVRFL